MAVSNFGSYMLPYSYPVTKKTFLEQLLIKILLYFDWELHRSFACPYTMTKDNAVSTYFSFTLYTYFRNNYINKVNLFE